MGKEPPNQGEDNSIGASTGDAQVILQLYELRRDPAMRDARHFISANFWPENAEDVLRLARSYPSQENTYLRQVTSYWEMAASLVHRAHSAAQPQPNKLPWGSALQKSPLPPL